MCGRDGGTTRKENVESRRNGKSIGVRSIHHEKVTSTPGIENDRYRRRMGREMGDKGRGGGYEVWRGR